MIHLRVVSPGDVTNRLVTQLESHPGVMSLVVLEGVTRSPVGDAVEFDLMSAEANEVLAELRNLELDERGSIVIERGDSYLSARADRIARTEPAFANNSPIWEDAEARIRSLGAYPPSWYALLVIAGLIAAVGILTNSQILIVAAMVVCPEYSAIINVSLGWRTREVPRVRSGLVTLVVGFAITIGVTVVFALVVRAFDLQPVLFEHGVRPVSNLINSPNAFSVVVAVLAGIVGVVSLTEARANALIGVFISVTTIPAAADIAVSSAFGSWREVRGSFIQLVLNVGILIAVGAAGLVLQRRLWDRIESRVRYC
jgi:uncharacterized hydrophobic protein (TIGR00271 family)